MGLNLSWIGVQGEQKTAVLDRLGFEEIGETGDEVGADYACAELPGGWLIVLATDRVFDVNDTLAKVASKGSSLSCSMSETVMVSEVRAFRNGRALWSVLHDPDKDPQGFVVAGALPPQFDEILRRLEGEQAAPGNEDVDCMFDLPLELAASICGYRAGQTRGLEWTVLQRSAPSRGALSGPRQKSLSAAMRSELLPLLKSQGWEFRGRPSLSDPGQIFRRLGGQKQTIWFDFGSGLETYIIVHFQSAQDLPTGSRHVVHGYVRDAPVRLPLWKRFTWKHLCELTRSYPTSVDPITDTIERAKDEIRAVDTFFATGERASCIYLQFAGAVDRQPEG